MPLKVQQFELGLWFPEGVMDWDQHHGHAGFTSEVATTILHVVEVDS